MPCNYEEEIYEALCEELDKKTAKLIEAFEEFFLVFKEVAKASDDRLCKECRDLGEKG